jgi:hypothetical protein
MRPKIKSISTIDGGDPASHRPLDAAFSVGLRLLIGPDESTGEESFDVTVCSPAWLEKKCERDSFVQGRHHIVVRDYDFSLVQRILTELVGRCNGETWPEIAKKISRFAYWEFEDYRSTDRA